MKKVLVGFLFCLLMVNCSKKEKIQKPLTYVISKENIKFSKELKIRKITPPSTYFYSYNNFIIDKNGDFYFYQKEYVPMNCIQSEIDTIPHLYNIQPIEVIKIPKNNVIDFIKENILIKVDFQHRLVIASQKDTIKSETFQKVFNFLNDSTSNWLKFFAVRKTTQEEDTVLKYKKNNLHYRSEDIKWDNNRITFPFIKPKLRHSN